MFRKRARCRLVIFAVGLTACSTTGPPTPEPIPSHAATPSAGESSEAASRNEKAPPPSIPPIHPKAPPVEPSPTSPPRPVAAPPEAVPKSSPAPTPDPLKAVRDCLKRNIPKKSSTQVLHFESVDRLGGKRECRGKLLGAQLSDGLRRVKVCITAPADVAGTEFLSIEAPGREPDSFLYLPAERKIIRITGSGMGGRVCGSDMSFEDLEHWQQQNRAEHLERLPDAAIGGHPVYVVSATPRDRAQSSYSKVTSYVDQKTCVVVKSESFQNGDAPRKVMTADPEQMLEDGGIYAPSEVLVEDLRDGTHTTVSASELEVDAFDPRSLELSTLGRHCR